VIFDPKGPRCGCGHRGCLEAFISGPALAGRIRRDIQGGRATVLKKTVRAHDIPEAVVGKWCEAVKLGDAYALEMRDMLADFVSRAATIAINCYDPDVVILTGFVCLQSPEYLIQAIERRMQTDVYDVQARAIQILPALSGEEALIRGAAAAVLRQSLALG
jgi:predicted NBD/HSP70 family sugar kinase